MKVTILVETLREIVGSLTRLLPSKATNPVLTQLSLEVVNGVLIISGTNLTEYLTIEEYDGEDTESGNCVVYAKAFQNILSKMNKEDMVTLERKGESLHITTENVSIQLAAGDWNQDIKHPEWKENKVDISISSLVFRDLNKLLAVASNDLSKGILCGINLTEVEENKNNLLVSVTDGHTAVITEMPCQNRSSEKVSITIPGSALGLVLPLLSRYQGEVSVSTPATEEQLISIRCGNMILVSRFMNGAYPDLKSLFPTQSNAKIIVNNKDFNGAINLMLSVSSSVVKLDVDLQTDSVRISGRGDISEGSTVLSAQIDSAAPQISFNGQYGLKLFRCIEDDLLEISILDEKRPIVFTNGGEAERVVKFLLMPIVIQGQR